MWAATNIGTNVSSQYFALETCLRLIRRISMDRSIYRANRLGFLWAKSIHKFELLKKDYRKLLRQGR